MPAARLADEFYPAVRFFIAAMPPPQPRAHFKDYYSVEVVELGGCAEGDSKLGGSTVGELDGCTEGHSDSLFHDGYSVFGDDGEKSAASDSKLDHDGWRAVVAQQLEAVMQRRRAAAHAAAPAALTGIPGLLAAGAPAAAAAAPHSLFHDGYSVYSFASNDTVQTTGLTASLVTISD